MEPILVNRKPCKCPKCGGKVVKIVYGMPTPELYEQSERKEVILGGCCIHEDGDPLIGDTSKFAALKNQKDGKLIDHIYMDKSLIGKDSNIYYIGEIKYYSDSHDIEGVPLYKQFTYARNTIQYNIDQYYLQHKANPNAIRYRDKDIVITGGSIIDPINLKS